MALDSALNFASLNLEERQNETFDLETLLPEEQVKIGLDHEEKNKDKIISKPIDHSKPPRYFNKLPPIYISVTDILDWLEKVKVIKSEGIESKELVKIDKHRTRVIATSLESFKKVLKLCNDNKWHYYTYGLPSKRKLKVCVKGLPEDVDLKAVKQTLTAIGIPVCRIHRMSTTQGLERPPYYMIVCNYTNEGLEIFKMNQILEYPITVERLTPQVGQCHRCQKWGHSQRYCQLQPKCVKCAGEHFTSKCTKERDESPMCANCCKDHTANYRKCPKAVEYALKNGGKPKM